MDIKVQSMTIDKTNSTPYVKFDYENGCLEIRGESFPENSAKFYSPIIEQLQTALSQDENKKWKIEFEIVYFNSSTSKVFMTLFDMLDEKVLDGRDISVVWRCDKENEISIECGEEFKEDLSNLTFTIELFE